MKSISNIDNLSTKKSLNIKGNLIDLSKPIIMGILNVTPDSFFDGNLYNNTKKALIRVEEMINEGAEIIDIGGCSTKPGSEIIDLEEEWERIGEITRETRNNFPNIIISIDTFRSEIAKRSSDYGANIINDVSGGEFDSNMFNTISKIDLPYVLMHSRGNSKTMLNLIDYDELLVDIILYFVKKINSLHSLGVKDVIVDPGFGFAKTYEQNIEILYNLDCFSILDLPILVGLSRKSFVQKKFNVSLKDSLKGSIKLNTVAIQKHASILRVHDVKGTKLMMDKIFSN